MRLLDGAYYTTCTRIDCSVSTCSRNRCTRPVSVLCSILCIPVSVRLNPFDERNEMVLDQDRPIRNPVGQQVKNHRWFPYHTSGLTTPYDRSTDAKTGQRSLQTSLPFIHSLVFPPTDWQLWTAATLTDETMRTTMITLVKKYASSKLNDGPFPDRYNSESGKMATFENRAVVGGHFALVRCLLPFEVVWD